ncbi:MAG: CalS11 [Nitrospira sp.]|jgi:hypothetical protein|nr:CalS11 [Nitrospira sp.]
MKAGQGLRLESGRSSEHETDIREKLSQLFQECPIPDDEVLANLGLFIKRKDLSRILFLQDLYKQILQVHGVVVEFGVRYGNNLALMQSLRGIYEPFNHNRKILGFDSFQGFPSVHEKDGGSVSAGSFSVTRNYEDYLSRVMAYHEQESPISHIQKYKLIKGDASVEVERYFKENPETIVALAYFDFDLYEPTKKCLEIITNHVTKGTIIAFDQLNDHDFPGETLALKEVWGLDKYRIRRSPVTSLQSYMVIE